MTTAILKEDEELHQAFKLFDTNGDGLIEVNELIEIMKSFGRNPTAEEAQDIINEYDVDRDGFIDFSEFKTMMSKGNTSSSSNSNQNSSKKEKTVDDHIEAAFSLFDMDGNGRIDFEEMKTVFKNLGEDMRESEVKELFNEADLDGDGFIDKEEFINIYNSIEGGR